MRNSSEMMLHINTLMEMVENQHIGLPHELFYFISQLTPLVNVDLLIKNSQRKTLLVWRDDRFYGPGWHVPGGIIRFKESAIQRVHEVAKSELGAKVEVGSNPIAVCEMMAPDRDVRGHFISLLYVCSIVSGLKDTLKASALDEPKHGQWKWHEKCPDSLIRQHLQYSKYINTFVTT